MLDLLRLIYFSTAAGGRFGRTPGIDGDPLEKARLGKNRILSELIHVGP